MSDQAGNTLGCRNYHAEMAKTDATTHCVHAGPSGGGVCGTPCEGFCTIVVPICPSEYTVTNCPGDCAGYNTTPPYTANTDNGDSLECRFTAATKASTAPTNNCPDTGGNSNACQ